PTVLDRVLAKRKTPWVATLVTSAIAMAMLPLGKVEIVASISSFAALLAFVAVNVALIALRRRDPDRERPFRVPLAIRGVPVLPIIGVLASVALLTRLDYRALLIGGALALLTLAVDVVVRRRKRAGTV
ncbi:MAG: amino acid permease, partial [Sandaracinaceae bacterium]|nr:amino acid permease [Sandaracinaceae bacterium]